ncbi:MAG: DUF998 domain-containing protein [Jatrophihabitans sp.]
MRRPPWWALVSSVSAPVFLVGGWVAAQAVQPPGYDAVHDTISALARHGLDHRWIMTLGLAGLGVAHFVTSVGLSALRWWSRLVLALAGVSTALVAVLAEPYRGSSSAHAVCAAIGFVTLALWPATAARYGSKPRPFVLRPSVAWSVTVLSSALLIWFAVTLSSGPVGVSERLLTAQQALWPLIVVVTLRRVPRGGDRIGA